MASRGGDSPPPYPLPVLPLDGPIVEIGELCTEATDLIRNIFSASTLVEAELRSRAPHLAGVWAPAMTLLALCHNRADNSWVGCSNELRKRALLQTTRPRRFSTSAFSRTLHSRWIFFMASPCPLSTRMLRLRTRKSTRRSVVPGSWILAWCGVLFVPEQGPAKKDCRRIGRRICRRI